MKTTMQKPPKINPDDLKEIRMRMYFKFTFWAVLAERFAMYSSMAVPTAAIDVANCNIYFNPVFWNGLTTAQRTFLIAHEIAHAAFDHEARCGGRERQKWNIACDLAINPLLVEEMGTSSFIKGGLLDETFKDKPAEIIYALLPKSDGGSSGKKKGPGGHSLGDNRDLFPDLGDGQTQEISPARQGKITSAQEMTEAVASAMVQAKMRGNMPAGLERAIQERLKPKVDWVARLSQLVRQSMVGPRPRDFRWLPPNRRFIHQGMYFPRIAEGCGPKVAWAIDTSGSRSDKNLVRAFSEIDAARKQFGAACYLMDCDADVHGSGWIMPHQPLPTPKGGGGTDFRPVFDHIAENQLSPDVLIFFTDTWGSFPDAPPPYPVIWVVDVPEGNVPWGEMIRIVGEEE